MSLKTSQSELNLSNGFKKRLLRPVSTQKNNDPKNNMKNSTLLSLHDHISIKNKYTEAKNILQNAQNILTSINHEKSLHLENLIKSIRQKKQQQKLDKKNDKAKNNLTNVFPKSMQIILSEIGAQNLQQGLKILHMEMLGFESFLDDLFCVLTYYTNKIIAQTQSQKIKSVFELNENDEKSILISKLMNFLVQKSFQGQKSTKIHENNQHVTQTKFKPIITYEDIQKTKQMNSLKLQLQQQKTLNAQLQNQLTSIKNLQTSPIKQTIPINLLQNIHNQIKQIYEQSLTKKDQIILKLKDQLLSYQQKFNKQSFSKNQQKNSSINFSKITDNDKEFNATIQQQFEKMRNGFAKKFQQFSLENKQKQQKLNKQIYNLQNELQNTQRQRNVLFKKYEFLLNNS